MISCCSSIRWRKAAGGPTPLWGAVTIFSVLGVVALSLLELFVAFLQAYIFVFLTSLFMGMALHPEHSSFRRPLFSDDRD